MGVGAVDGGQAHLFEVVGAADAGRRSRTFCTAGSSRPMRMAMMAITTNNSISVNPRQDRRIRNRAMIHLSLDK
jgi:hypothetical protein